MRLSGRLATPWMVEGDLIEMFTSNRAGGGKQQDRLVSTGKPACQPGPFFDPNKALPSNRNGAAINGQIKARITKTIATGHHPMIAKTIAQRRSGIIKILRF
jgi:hypothetical protein